LAYRAILASKYPGPRKRMAPRYSPETIAKGILAGDNMWLSRGITLVESERSDDQDQAAVLLEILLPYSGKSTRIGLTGVPGVGKSTFIEAFGTLITKQNLKLAVLSVDPSSAISHGSILGDKTRMQDLSKNPLAFIRPSPSGTALGGVAGSTRDSILLCEAAGYDVVLVETVGVGQSETMVKDMVDFFLLLLLPGGGDELQGIKRGIMEMADGLFINKADGNNLKRAQIARKDYENALHLFLPVVSGWKIPVLTGSALERTGLESVWTSIREFRELTMRSGHFLQNRKHQELRWLHQLTRHRLEMDFFNKPENQDKIKQAETAIEAGQLSVRKAVDGIFKK
jgi:LAO/AO transport system kinase